MPISDFKRAVIVGERFTQPGQNPEPKVYLGYELGPGEAVAFQDLVDDNEIVTAYARIANGDIWRFHTDGSLSWNARERYPLRSLASGFNYGESVIRTNALEHPVDVTQIVLVTNRSTTRELADLETGGRYNDISTRYRLMGGKQAAKDRAAGPEVVRLGFGPTLRQRYGESLSILDTPANPEVAALGVSGQYPYAFVKHDVVPARGAPFSEWSLVLPGEQLPIRVNEREATLAGMRTVSPIYGVIDLARTRGVAPMCVRPIEDRLSPDDLHALRDLTHASRARLLGPETPGR